MFVGDLDVRFNEFRNWELLAPLKYVAPSDYFTVYVPTGFYTDGASVPFGFWNLFPPMGPWLKAAVVHDYLYVMGQRGRPQCTKEKADAVFLEAMTELGVDKIRRALMYRAVRIGGNGGKEW